MILTKLILFALSPSTAFAAACCGGGFSMPSILLGDDKAQITASLANTSTPIDVATSGKWLTRKNPEVSQTLKLEGASLLSDRWQAGGALPITRRSRVGPEGDQAASGVGDLAFDIAYEALPEWDYSTWRPKGLVFIQAMLPTGRSRLESTQDLNLDITGRGLLSVGPGVILSKIILPFDVSFYFETHGSFDREISSPAAGATVRMRPGFGGSTALSSGYNHGNFRYGLSVLSSYEDAIRTEGAPANEIALERVTTTSASVAYLLDLEWAAAATYSDQTLFGSPANTTLGRTLLVSLQKRWLR